MKKLVSILLVFMVASCVEKIIEKPENLIPRAKMVDILYEIAVFEAAETTNKPILEENNVDILKLVYANHEIDSIRFVESDLYYASIPLVYQSIYEEVEARIEEDRSSLELKRKQQADSVRQRAKRKTDSLLQVDGVKKTSENLP